MSICAVQAIPQAVLNGEFFDGPVIAPGRQLVAGQCERLGFQLLDTLRSVVPVCVGQRRIPAFDDRQSIRLEVATRTTQAHLW